MRCHALYLRRFGEPEILEWDKAVLSGPGQGEILLRQTAAGVNFIDIYHRTGLYPLDIPTIPGVEGVRIVEAVGSDVAQVEPGDRIGYVGEIGAYAEMRLLRADRVILLPDDVDIPPQRLSC